jgi:SulP family sulfate permease
MMDGKPAAQKPGRGQRLAGWMASALSGILTGGVSVVASVSLAALIFSGDIAAHLDYGIHVALVTASIVGLMVSLTGSCGVAVAIPQDRTAPILAIMAAAIAAAAPEQASGGEVLLHIALAIAGTTFATGAFLLGLGLARAGGLIRFMPYSVLSGFLAGTGWLLVIGGLRVMTGQELDTAVDFAALFNDGWHLRWLPGVALASAIVLAASHLAYAMVLPAALLAATCVFYALAISAGETIDTLGQSGWLLGPLKTAPMDFWASRLDLMAGDADWSALLSQWPSLGSILIISAVSILLTVSALELLSGRDMDINHELKVTGLANLAAGLGGGMVGFHSLSVSSLVITLGEKNRVPGVVAALTCGAVLLLGAEIIGLLPRVIAGGLLVSLGFSFLLQWLLGSFKRLAIGEYLLVPLILLIIATVGFVEGVLAGLLAALVIFVLNYSRTPLIRHTLTGAQMRSSVERNLDDERCLRRHGERLYVLKPSGYLFFGTATQVLTRVQERADDPGGPHLTGVLIDFARVSGIDSSATYAFHRLRQLAKRRGFRLVLTGLRGDLRDQTRLERIAEDNEQVLLFADLDHGLEWCENRLLDELGHGGTRVSRTILERLAALFPEDPEGSRFRGYLSEVSFQSGQELIKQGEAATDLYFLESGEVSVFLRRADGTSVRLRRTGAGTILGELGFYLDLPRTASVLADRPGKAYRLTVASLARMESEQPQLAAALHRFMAYLLAERLVNTTQALETLLD